MSNVDDLTSKLEELKFLKEKQKALDSLVEERRKELLTGMKALGLTKLGDGEGNITARIKKTTSLQLVSVDRLMEHVSDPEVFAQVLLSKMRVTKVIVAALDNLGVPASQLVIKKESSNLQVNMQENKSRIEDSQREYYRELEQYIRGLHSAVVQKKMEELGRPVFPQQSVDSRAVAAVEGE
jgi:hypothetical protein